MGRAPVALFVYNRPRHTRQTVEALSRNEGARDTDLFIFSDGAKTPDVQGAVQETREYTKTITGFRSVQTIERPVNLGLRGSIIDGVTRLSEECGRVVVLEDDLLTSRYFLEFMNAGLDAYESEDHVMQIAGYMFPSTAPLTDDAILLPFVTSWGWATWNRAWRHFDPTGSGYERLESSKALRSQFDLNGHYKYFKLLRAQREGRSDSWAILWYLSVFLRQGLGLFPRTSMVRNIGFDGSGANRFTRTFEQGELNQEFRVSKFPIGAAVSPFSDAVIRGLPSPKLSLASILQKLKNLYSRR